MTETRATLLIRLRNSNDQEAWSEFHRIYAPLLYRYARQRGLPHVDAEEIRDQCLLAVSRKISTLDYDRSKGRFKGWLYKIANGKVVDLLRKRQESRADTNMLSSIPDPNLTPEQLWDQQWRYRHLLYCAELVRTEFSEQTYRIFELLAFEEHSVNGICQDLGVSRDQVYNSKSRVLRRIRQRVQEIDPEF